MRCSLAFLFWLRMADVFLASLVSLVRQTCFKWSTLNIFSWQKWATQWAQSEDSDQTGRILWSDWADAQADRSLRWAHSHFVGFVMRRLNSVWRTDLLDSDIREYPTSDRLLPTFQRKANFTINKHMSLVTRQPVLRVCDKGCLKPACSATETS